MKGLMVSLIIVFFAGTTSTVLAAGQQDAAGFKSPFGLHPIAAPPFERPGPDDSDNSDVLPTPTSLLSRESTNTSSYGDRQFAAPTPAPTGAMDDNIRFDVKVNPNAIDLLRQGKKVYSPVKVRDRATNTALDSSVVSDIALFLDTNAEKKLQTVQLYPQPMEPSSKTLRFEIPEEQLDRIEQDAFVFSVPDEMRGKFDHVEFVASPAVSHEFSPGMTSGTRGSALGFGDGNGTSRFESSQNDNFGAVNESPRWNNPQPGPGFAPGDREFTGPVIAKSELEARRNRVGSFDQNRNPNTGQQFVSNQQREPARAPLNTGGRFRLSEQLETPTTSRFSLPRQQPETNQNTFNQDRNTTGQNTFPPIRSKQPTAEPGYRESMTDQRLRSLEQQLAAEKAEKESLQRNATDLMREADILAQQRNNLSEQLKSETERRFVAQQSNSQQVGFQQQYAAGRDYLGGTLEVASNLARPFGSRREDFQRRETAFDSRTPSQLDQQKIIEDQRREIENQRQEKLDLQIEKIIENRVAKELENRPTYSDSYQPIGYSSPPVDDNSNRGNGRDGTGREKGANANTGNRQGANALVGPIFGQAATKPNPRAGRGDGQLEKLGTNKNDSSDLIWLLPLLLGSLGLNFFLWVHSRSLYLRYNDLADELRGMVGGSTI